ncbi:MAG: thioredoxin 2 [Thermoleophilaceae bacterium]|jgi:thioredoxin 2|nr:thioredoxin 2 [Thermoleophilaceae bacterium]
MVDASEARFDAELAASVPVVVDFWAPWCAPCKMIAPALEELAREHAGRLKVVRLNVDEAPATSAKYGVRGIPLLMLARDGNEVDRLVGAVPQKQIEAWLEPHMGLASGTA